MTAFVESVRPVALSVLFTQGFDEDRKGILSNLAALRPELIVPDILDR